MRRISNGPLVTIETRRSNVPTAAADVGDGDGIAEAVGSGEAVGGADSAAVGEADGAMPPPHAQHMSFEEKSASS